MSPVRGNDESGSQKQKGLDKIGPDDCREPSQNGIAGRDRGQPQHNQDVVRVIDLEGNLSALLHRLDEVPAHEEAGGSSTNVERRHHLYHGHDKDQDERVQKTAALVITLAEVLGQGVDIERPVDGKEAVAEQHQPRDCPELEVTLRETHSEADPHHADQVVGADVAAKNRTGNAPPGNLPSGQKVVNGQSVPERKG